MSPPAGCKEIFDCKSISSTSSSSKGKTASAAGKTTAAAGKTAAADGKTAAAAGSSFFSCAGKPVSISSSAAVNEPPPWCKGVLKEGDDGHCLHVMLSGSRTSRIPVQLATGAWNYETAMVVVEPHEDCKEWLNKRVEIHRGTATAPIQFADAIMQEHIPLRPVGGGARAVARYFLPLEGLQYEEL